MTEIKYPGMRDELVEHLRALSDLDYQRRVWVAKESDGAVEHDEFDYAVHFLFDDTKLADDARAMIGWILENESEAELVGRLARAIDGIFHKYGTSLSDAEYISLPEWRLVLDAAKIALLAIGHR